MIKIWWYISPVIFKNNFKILFLRFSFTNFVATCLVILGTRIYYAHAWIYKHKHSRLSTVAIFFRSLSSRLMLWLIVTKFKNIFNSLHYLCKRPTTYHQLPGLVRGPILNLCQIKAFVLATMNDRQDRSSQWWTLWKVFFSWGLSRPSQKRVAYKI